MPKNVLFLLKNCQTLGGSAPRPPCPRRLGAQTPTSVILHCEFFSLHCPQSTESTKRPYFLVIIAGVHQVFGVKKLCCISYATDYENYNHRFPFFRFVPPTNFALAPPLGHPQNGAIWGVPMGQKVATVTKILFLFPKSNISKNQTCNTLTRKLTLRYHTKIKISSFYGDL